MHIFFCVFFLRNMDLVHICIVFIIANIVQKKISRVFNFAKLTKIRKLCENMYTRKFEKKFHNVLITKFCLTIFLMLSIKILRKHCFRSSFSRFFFIKDVRKIKTFLLESLFNKVEGLEILYF